MINAIAIDDEPPALQLISHFCKESGLVDMKRTFTNPEDALKFLKKFPVDLVFLDIMMPAILGTELRNYIAKEKAIVFTTAYAEYAAQCFDLDATDYLVKPYSLERFVSAIEKVKLRLGNQLQQQDEDTAHIMLRADYSLVKIALSEISYIEGLEDYSKIYFSNKETVPMIFRITMKSLLEKLPEGVFLRVHRSYIVRTDKVEKLRSNTLFLEGVEVPIGRSYKNETVEFFKKQLKEE